MPPPEAQPAPLQQLGAYDLLVKLAEGGMGTVYKGRHRDSGRLVAIKTVPPATARHPVLMQRFEQEFLAAKKLEHPNVVAALEYCGTGPTPFLVMEFVEGESLGQRIEREGPIPEAEALRILAQVCQGLHRAHKQGLIHRDVKPDNIMVTPEGVAKLTDMGLVKDVEGELNLTRTGRGLGTPHFMAPEQFRNAKYVDVRSDIYSLGATLYMALTGDVPFAKCGPLDCWMKKVRNDFPAPRDVNPDVSERVDWAIRRSMSGDPEQRPATCREFIEDLSGGPVKQPSAAAGEGDAVAGDVWYLVYKDEEGKSHTVKGSTDGIRRALKDGLLGDAANVLACRSKQGPFQPLRGHAEFRDLVITPSALPPTGSATPVPPPARGGNSSVMPGRTGARPVSSSTAPTVEESAVDLGEAGRATRAGRTGAGTVGTSGRLPHIPLKADRGGGLGSVLLWALVLALAGGGTFAAVMFLPKLLK